jgi:hypothetical protein
MIRTPAIFCLLSIIAASAADLPDLLRFTNDDQLRGTFRGMQEGPQVLWKNEDLAEPAAFKTNRIRHIVLRGGRPLKQLGTLSHADLINGDKVPGIITALDEKSVTLDTGYVGKLIIPRDRVTMLAPNPLGGRVAYYGPFAEDDWKMIHGSFPGGMPAENAKKEGDENSETPGRWSFSGSSWYWNHKSGGTALIRESGMPERSVLRFDLAWKSRLNLSIALHADFASSQPGERVDRKQENHGGVLLNPASLPRLFGNSYVLQLYSNYITLLRTSVDADGKPAIERPRGNGGASRLGETGRSRIELRSNRRTGEITLFVNDEFTAQWNGLDMAADEAADGDAAGKGKASGGSGFGFVAQGVDSPVRISDIIMSEWNGMPDSARSLQMDEQDVVLMANGTDRYSGKVGRLDEQGGILFEGRHGRFRFPLEDVSEIRFAKQGLAAASEPPADNVLLRLAPIGSISGQPLPGEGPALGLISPIVGRIDLSLDPAVMIEFNASSSPFDDWNADF